MSQISLAVKPKTGEVNDPKKTIQELFSNFHHNEIKEGLWEWYKITVCENYTSLPGRHEREFITTLLEEMNRLVDAAWLLQQQEKNSE